MVMCVLLDYDKSLIHERHFGQKMRFFTFKLVRKLAKSDYYLHLCPSVNLKGTARIPLDEIS